MLKSLEKLHQHDCLVHMVEQADVAAESCFVRYEELFFAVPLAITALPEFEPVVLKSTLDMDYGSLNASVMTLSTTAIGWRGCIEGLPKEFQGFVRQMLDISELREVQKAIE